MLADFRVPVGDGYALVARDVATAVFFYGFPNSLLGAECYHAVDRRAQRQLDDELAQWTIDLLTRVIVRPRLTPELVHRLGSGADEAAIGYLHAIDWIQDRDIAGMVERGGPRAGAASRYWRERGAESARVLKPAPAARRRTPELNLRPLTTTAAPNVRLAVKLMAERTHLRPSAIWASPISEFIYDWRALLTDELTEAAAAGASAVYTNDPSLLER